MARKAHDKPVAAPHEKNYYNYFETASSPDVDPSARGNESLKEKIVANYDTARQVVDGVFDTMSEELVRSLQVRFSGDDEGGIKKAVIDYLAPRFETTAPGEPTPEGWLDLVRDVQALQERVRDKEEQIMSSPEFATLSALSHDDRSRQLKTFETLRGLKDEKGNLRFFKGMGAKSDPTSRWRRLTDSLFRSKEEQDALDVFMTPPGDMSGGLGREGDDLDMLEEAHEALQNIHDLERLRALRTQLFETFFEATGIHRLAKKQVDEHIRSFETAKKTPGDTSTNQGIIERLEALRSLDKRGIPVLAEKPREATSRKKGVKEVADRIAVQDTEIAKSLSGSVKRVVTGYEFHSFGDARRTLLGELQKELARFLNVEKIGTVEGSDRLAFFADLFARLAEDADVKGSKNGQEKIAILRAWARTYQEDYDSSKKK